MANDRIARCAFGTRASPLIFVFNAAVRGGARATSRSANHIRLKSNRASSRAFFSAESRRSFIVMPDSERDDEGAVEHGPTMPCADRTRRALLLSALATGACLAAANSAFAEDDQSAADI